MVSCIQRNDKFKMLDISADIKHWLQLNLPVGLATVLKTWGSSPRSVGSKMAFTIGEKIVGSVSGGCVEGAVYEAGLEVIKSGIPKLLHFGVTDETALGVGLSCGGSIDIWVRKLDHKIFYTTFNEILNKKVAVIVSLIQGPKELMGTELVMNETGILVGGLNEDLDNWLTSIIELAINKGHSHILQPKINRYDSTEIFFDIINPPPVLIIIGGTHISVVLASIAKTIGYSTIVIDPRRAFINQERFPNVDQLVHAWPDEAFRTISITQNTCVAVLTHDPKIDDPAIKIVLDSPAFYIGALGSRKTHKERCQRLLAEGLFPDQLKRIKSPIGLDLGGKNPEEIAIAIMAEIVSTYRKKGVPKTKN